MPRYVTNPPSAPTRQEQIEFEDVIGLYGLKRPPQWYVIGNADPRYNCVAWTLGIKETTLGTEQNPFPLDGVNEFYAAFGYRSTHVPANGIFQTYDVVAYGPSQTEVAHVAVYLNVNGVGPTWTSKMGGAQLITHAWYQLVSSRGGYGDYFPAYYTHNGTIPIFTGQTPEGESFEQTVQRLLQQHGLDRL